MVQTRRMSFMVPWCIWLAAGIARGEFIEPMMDKPAAVGFVAYNDHIAGTSTHANTTCYSGAGGQTASGPMKNMATGANIPVTLSTTQSGASYLGSQSDPAPDTDAYRAFNGFVDLGAGTDAGIDLKGTDTYTYTFSGLITSPAVRYDFVGTAVRGDSRYTDRWTQVTLVGAASATATHSSGTGVIVLSATEVAIWTGANNQPGQGYVAHWADIDPGPDGQFSVVSRQYTDAIPTSIDSIGIADGIKGYGITGIRLMEVSEPATLSLLGFGGLALIRRRRR